MTSAEDVNATNNNTTQLTFDPYMKDMMLSFGASPGAVDKMFEVPPKRRPEQSNLEPNPSQKPLAHLAEAMIRTQLHPGKHLDDLQGVFLQRIHDLVSWDSLTPHSDLRSDSTREVSLLDWTRNSLLEGATTAFFGKALKEIEPHLFDNFFEFDDKSWKLTYKVPPPWCNDMIAAKDTAQKALTQYFELPRDLRTGECWLVRALEAELRERQVGSSDIAAYFMMIYWVYGHLISLAIFSKSLIFAQNQCQCLETLLLGLCIPSEHAFPSLDCPRRNPSNIRKLSRSHSTGRKACGLSSAHGSLLRSLAAGHLIGFRPKRSHQHWHWRQISAGRKQNPPSISTDAF